MGMLLNELTARLNLLSHEGAENFIRHKGIIHFQLQYRAFFRIHGSFPQLIRIHFTQTFVALDDRAGTADPFEDFFKLAVVKGIV